MIKPMVKDITKKKPGDIVMTSRGWVKVLRGGRHVTWTPLDNRNKSL